MNREIVELAEILQILEHTELVPDEDDIRVWDDGSVEFNSKTVYKYLEGIRMDIVHTREINFPVKKIWLKSVPSKVDFSYGPYTEAGPSLLITWGREVC